MLKKYRIIGYIIVIIMCGVFFILYKISDNEKNANKLNKIQANFELNVQEVLINNTVREQQRRILQGMRQSFINFTNEYNIELIDKNSKGYIHYGNIKGDNIYYNPDTMYIRNDWGKFYNIHDKNTHELLAGHVRPYFNKKNIEFILSVVAEQYKVFGNTGDVIIYDSYTGQMLLDNSEDCKDSEEVIGEDKNRYLTLDYRHKNNKNPNACMKVIEKQMMWRKDSTNTDKMIYYFNEPNLNFEDGNNFSTFPLGLHNREFQEKIILPFETVGIGNMEMQITVISGAQEKEITEPYKAIIEQYRQIKDVQGRIISNSTLYPIIAVILALIAIVLISLQYQITHRYCTNNTKR